MAHLLFTFPSVPFSAAPGLREWFGGYCLFMCNSLITDYVLIIDNVIYSTNYHETSWKLLFSVIYDILLLNCISNFIWYPKPDELMVFWVEK